MSIKLSVIVPVYNVERYLAKTIDSILNQSLKDIEIILIDDCSTDSSPTICDKYASMHNNIRVVHKHQNEGLGMACNTGLENAIGEYFAFCDSDDWLDTQMYKQMVQAAEKYHVDAVFTGLKRVDDNGNILGYMYHTETLRVYDKPDELHNLILDMIASQPSERETRQLQVSAKVVLYRNEIIKKNNLRFVSEREIPSEDQCFNLSFLANSKSVCVLPKYFYNYRITQNSISTSIREDLFEKTKGLYNYTYTLCKENNIVGAKIRLDRMLIDYTRNFLSNVQKSDLTDKRKMEIIRNTCEDSIWKDIWKDYPISRMWWKHRIFSYAMKYRYYKLISLLTKL